MSWTEGPPAQSASIAVIGNPGLDTLVLLAEDAPALVRSGQGLDDPVCPATIARRVFDRLPLESKRWVELPGARHEPFADAHIESLLTEELGNLFPAAADAARGTTGCRE